LVAFLFNWHLAMGDIVVGDIGQPQYHKCIKKQNNIVKEKEERHL